jgi:DNA-binding NarL/FixJ family response regulator
MRAARTFAIDRRPLRRSGLARISRQAGCAPALALADLEQADAARELTAAEPEVLLLGLELGDDIEALVGKARWLAPIVVAILDDENPALARRVLGAGADGCLLSRELDVDVLAKAIASVQAGRPVMPAGDKHVEATTIRGIGNSITERCRQVLTLMAEGLHDGEVAAQLGISTSSVRKHVAVAQERLGARTRTQAVAMAAREGLL